MDFDANDQIEDPIVAYAKNPVIYPPEIDKKKPVCLVNFSS